MQTQQGNKKTEEEARDCLIAVTCERTRSGDLFWVVWINSEVVAEEDSAEMALCIARAAIMGV